MSSTVYLDPADAAEVRHAAAAALRRISRVSAHPLRAEAEALLAEQSSGLDLGREPESVLATARAGLELSLLDLLLLPGPHPSYSLYGALHWLRWMVAWLAPLVDPGQVAPGQGASPDPLLWQTQMRQWQFQGLLSVLGAVGRGQPGEQSDPQQLTLLQYAARHPEAAVREATQGVLVRLGQWGSVVQALQDEAPSVRAAATSALQAVGTPPAEVTAALEGALQDTDATVRRCALGSLRWLHVRPFPAPPAQPPALPPSAARGSTPPRFPWGPFLVRWSWRLLQLPELAFPPEVYQLPDAAFYSGWLGAPGATDAQLLAAEQRLGRQLPPSYREFLQLTNGWPVGLTEPLLPLDEVDLFQVKEPDMVRIWLETQEGPDVSEAEHRVYGEQQESASFRRAYLQTAVQISEQADGYVYLLNPEIVTPEGEWEAWILGSNIAGAQRWPSFWELVQDEAVTQFPGGPPDEAAGEEEALLPPEA